MRILELDQKEFGERLATAGIGLLLGPFVFNIKTKIPQVAESMHLLYADFIIEKTTEFSDFHVVIERRRWWRPQVFLLIDGVSPFYPLKIGLAVPLMEWGLNWCVATYGHSYLITHAAVLERGGQCLLLPAMPGAGKSTLCAALTLRGWRLFSDEMALIRPSDGAILPIPKPVSLKNKSIEIIRGFSKSVLISQTYEDPNNGLMAYMRPPKLSVERMHESAVPKWIVFPQYKSGASATIRDVKKSTAFMQLAGNTINYSLLGTVGFETVANLIDHCECYDFNFDELQQATDVLTRTVGPSVGKATDCLNQ